MAITTLDLPDDPEAAARRLREASAVSPVIVFKKSPICPISFHAEAEYRSWLESLGPDVELRVAEIDVIEQKPLARGLTKALGIEHQSPQALVFKDGELSWHDNHEGLTEEAFRQELGG